MPKPICFRELERAVPVERREEPAPRRAELDKDADLEVPIAADPVAASKPEPPLPATLEPASGASSPHRLQKPPSIVPPQPGWVHDAPSISLLPGILV
jgi:hypothetical protein